MRIILYGLIIIIVLVLLVMLYNRLYFEIHLARATKILNRELKKTTKQQVEEFSKELQDVLNLTIDAMTDTYQEVFERIKKENK